MKKYLSIILIVILNFTLFTGCINNLNTQESSEQVDIISQQSEEKEEQDNFSENQLYATVVKYDNNILEIIDENSNIKQINITLKEEVKRGYKIRLSYEENTENVKSYKIENFDNISSEQKVNQILQTLTIEEKVGQMFIGRCPESDAVQLAEKYSLGGYILFGRDFKNKTKQNVIDNINSYQDANIISMFIGVDEEGGEVNRVSFYKQFRDTPFSSPQNLYKKGGIELVISTEKEKARLLKSLGINLNFAPVADVSMDSNDYIYSRTLGRSPQDTAEYITSVVKTMNDEGLASMLKHFPGYGNNKNTHTGIAYDNRSLESFRKSDFLPFEAGIDAGVPTILVSHNIVKAMDEKYPASLSENVHKILKDELGFKGIIVTDDLAMDAIKDFVEGHKAGVLAVKAGNDLLCCDDFINKIPAVVEAVKSGEISTERIDQSVRKLLSLKDKLGIL